MLRRQVHWNDKTQAWEHRKVRSPPLGVIEMEPADAVPLTAFLDKVVMNSLDEIRDMYTDDGENVRTTVVRLLCQLTKDAIAAHPVCLLYSSYHTGTKSN